MIDTGYAIGIDIGGTKVAAGLVDVDGIISHRVRRDTPLDDPAGVEATVLAVARELADLPGVVAVGAGAPGVVDETGSVVRFAANLGWREVPLRARLQEATGLPTTVENDTNSACWGEVRFGAARGEPDVAFVGLGTGIGGGIVLGGQLYRGHSGMASEFGHVRVVPDGRPCGCGRRGCWEQYASGTALVREARERARDLPEAGRTLLAFGDGTPEGIDGPLLTRAPRLPATRWPWPASRRSDVGSGRGSLTSWRPSTREWSWSVAASRKQVTSCSAQPVQHSPRRSSARTIGRPPDLRLAALGNDAGLVGVADLSRGVTH